MTGSLYRPTYFLVSQHTIQLAIPCQKPVGFTHTPKKIEKFKELLFNGTSKAHIKIDK